VVWIARTAENVLGGIIRFILPESWYIPGIGLLLGIGLIFAVGVLLFVMTLVMNVLGFFVVRRWREKY
jgi:hypothetical protein